VEVISRIHLDRLSPALSTPAAKLTLRRDWFPNVSAHLGLVGNSANDELAHRTV
jgi:hypothetical protein